MPEYLAPGVYVEETSFRSKSLEGVSTSTAGFVGPTRYGPVSGDPELITSFLDFQRIYGGLDDLRFGTAPAQANYLAHAVRAFFEEGGRRLFVSRAFRFADDFAINTSGVPNRHYGHADTAAVSPPTPQITLRARFPGRAGNMRVTLTARLGANAFNDAPLRLSPPGEPTLARVQDHDLVFVHNGSTVIGNDGLHLVRWNAAQRRWELRADGATRLLGSLSLNTRVRPVTVTVDVEFPDDNTPSGFGSAQSLGEFGFDPRVARGLTNTFTRSPATRFLFLTVPFALEVPAELVDPDGDPESAAADNWALALARELLGPGIIGTFTNDRTPIDDRRAVFTLSGGDDGLQPDEETYAGREDLTDYIHDPLLEPKNGLLAFEGVEDISIVAAPGYSFGYVDDADRVLAIQNEVINHCEAMRYRIAVLDTPPNFLPTEALNYRNLRSSKYAAMYYPWVTVADPLSDGRLNLPPSGFIAGIYARNDIEHAVFKAPANEIVRSAIDFELRLNKAQQELLNPQGVNCLRYFPGRGFRVWGARTISDDPEWKYVNLRRYFAYLEHTIDRGTQWVVFENNGPQLWGNVRRTVEDFLFNEWKMGGLLGDKPEQAYFVRCDRSTMTQNDLDNGRLICLIGVAPVRPAEFVIFRIGQWTADATR